MKLEKATTEHLIYGLALLLAAALRFGGLGNVPLSDGEAALALQAAELARGGPGLLAGQPGYTLLTAAAFFLFGTGEFMARFWPALMGTGLVLAPYLYRERLGRSAAMVLALALAVEPVLVAASRQADGRMLAVTGLAFAGGFLLKGWLPGIGIGAGIAVLGGASAWNALLAVSLGCTVAQWSALKARSPIRRLSGSTHPGGVEAPIGDQRITTSPRWGAIVPWGVGTMVVVGALFGFFPAGLSALMNSLVGYARGWTATPGTGVALMLTGWTLLSPLSILFGLSGVVRAWPRRGPRPVEVPEEEDAPLAVAESAAVDQAIAWVWLFLFVLVLIYPQRQTADLAYAVVPLLALGARQVVRVFPPLLAHRTVYTYALLVAVLGVSIWMSASGFTNLATQDNALRWGGIAGAGFLLLASLLLVGWGWDWKAAWMGFVCGLSAVLLVYTLATAWSGAGLNNRPGNEIWVNGAYPMEQTLALKVLGDVSEWSTGSRDGVDVAVSGVDSPSLRWALRNFRNLSFISALAPDAKTSVVITPERLGANLGLAQPYTGQGLAWGQSVLWSELLAQDWLGWFFYRDLASRPDILNRQGLILWLRSDLFPAADKTGVAR